MSVIIAKILGGSAADTCTMGALTRDARLFRVHWIGIESVCKVEYWGQSTSTMLYLSMHDFH